MLDIDGIKFKMDANRNKIEQEENIIYTIKILNQRSNYMKNIILNIFVTEELNFLGGIIKRERGTMEIDGSYIDLEIGNLATDEEAKVIIEFKYTDKLPIEIEGYATITFDGDERITNKVVSNMVRTKTIA